MGKHDMKNEVKFSWEPMPDDFYKARINTLEKENLALREKIAKLEKTLGNYERVIDRTDEIHDGIVGELNDYIDNLEKAVVKAAIREVQA